MVLVQSLQLGRPDSTNGQQGMRRLNRLPISAAILLVVLVVGIVVGGLSWRGLSSNRSTGLESASGTPATNFGDQLKRGVADGIIGEPDVREIFQPSPLVVENEHKPAPISQPNPEEREISRALLEPEEDWKARLKREQDEQSLREAHRQEMARLQAQATALDAPLTVDVSEVRDQVAVERTNGNQNPDLGSANTSDLYAAALKSGLMGQNIDLNGQNAKEDFFNQDVKDLGYLPNRVVPQISPFELKRGSVIPATLITGLNSDLPGKIMAQVSQNVYDSATGYRLLIPQGTKLFGRYDAKVSFGQERVLVLWTDLFFRTDRPFRSVAWPGQTRRAMVDSKTKSTGICGVPSGLPHWSP